MVDADVDDNGRVLEFFGLEADQCPAVRLIQMGDSMAKFKPEDDALTTASFNAFVKVSWPRMTFDLKCEFRELKVAKLESIWCPKKNQKITPDQSTTSPERISPVSWPKLTNTVSFDDIGGDRDAYYFLVLIEFYAPWCGHCKALEPTYEKLGEHFKDQDDVIIAKTDATANEFEDVDVQGFPTIKFWAKGEDR